MAAGLGLAIVVAVVLMVVWVHRRRERAEEMERVPHRSTGTDNNNGSKAWIEATNHREARGKKGRKEKEKNGLKKKKGKDAGKRRREPLGEDAIRLRSVACSVPKEGVQTT